MVSLSSYLKDDLDQYLKAKNKGVRFLTFEQFLKIVESSLGEISREEYIAGCDEDDDDNDNGFTAQLNSVLINEKGGIAFGMGENLMNSFPIFCVAHDRNDNVVHGFISGLVAT